MSPRVNNDVDNLFGLLKCICRKLVTSVAAREDHTGRVSYDALELH